MGFKPTYPVSLNDQLAQYRIVLGEGEREVPDLIANAIFHGARAFRVNPGQLYREVFDASRSRYHFLHMADRFTTASTLLALQALVDPKSAKEKPEAHRLIVEAMQSDATWTLFLRNFCEDHIPPTWALGAVEFFGDVGGAAVELLPGSVQVFLGARHMIALGDPADIRFNSLVERALQAFRETEKPSHLHWKKKNRELQLRGLRPSKPFVLVYEAAFLLQKALESHANDLSLLNEVKANPRLRGRLKDLMTYLVAFGSERTARDAAEVLIALKTDRYERRAQIPAGKISPNAPMIVPNVARVIDMFKAIEPPELPVMREINEALEEQGRPPLCDYAELVECATLLREATKQNSGDPHLIDFMRQNIEYQGYFIQLLRYIANFGEPWMAGLAKRSLGSIQDLRAQEERSETPTQVKLLDPYDQGQVIAFFRNDLKVRIDRVQEKAVFSFWKAVWDDETNVLGRFSWDIDETLTDHAWSVPVWGPIRGRERVKLREVVIQHVALAMKTGFPVSYTSTVIYRRLVNFANQPEFGAFRFAISGRLPTDPDLTKEEARGLGNIMTYERANQVTSQRLIRISPTEIEALGRELAKRIAVALATASGMAKGVEVVGREGLADNKLKNLIAFRKSGGKLLLLIPVRYEGRRLLGIFSVNRIHPDPFASVPDILKAALEAQEYEGVVIPAEGFPSQFVETQFPQMVADVEHRDWIQEATRGWAKNLFRYWGYRGWHYLWHRNPLVWTGKELRKLLREAIAEHKTAQVAMAPRLPLSSPADPLPPPSERLARYPRIDPASLRANPIALLFDWSDDLLGLTTEALEYLRPEFIQGKDRIDLISWYIDQSHIFDSYDNAPTDEQIEALTSHYKSWAALMNAYDRLALFAAIQGRKITRHNIELLDSTLGIKAQLNAELMTFVKTVDLLQPAEKKAKGTKTIADPSALAVGNESPIDEDFLHTLFPNLRLADLMGSPLAQLTDLEHVFWTIPRSELQRLRGRLTSKGLHHCLAFALSRGPATPVTLWTEDDVNRLRTVDKIALLLALEFAPREALDQRVISTKIEELARAGPTDETVTIQDLMSTVWNERLAPEAASHESAPQVDPSPAGRPDGAAATTDGAPPPTGKEAGAGTDGESGNRGPTAYGDVSILSIASQMPTMMGGGASAVHVRKGFVSPASGMVQSAAAVAYDYSRSHAACHPGESQDLPPELGGFRLKAGMTGRAGMTAVEQRPATIHSIDEERNQQAWLKIVADHPELSEWTSFIFRNEKTIDYYIKKGNAAANEDPLIEGLWARNTSGDQMQRVLFLRGVCEEFDISRTGLRRAIAQLEINSRTVGRTHHRHASRVMAMTAAARTRTISRTGRLVGI